jgi:hypothetical protein
VSGDCFSNSKARGGSARTHDLVDRPELGEGALSNGRGQAVLHDEATGDDRGAEQRPQENKGRFRRAPHCIPNGQTP